MGKPLGLSSLVPFSTDDIQLGLHEWTGASRKFGYIQFISIREFWGISMVRQPKYYLRWIPVHLFSPSLMSSAKKGIKLEKFKRKFGN